MPNDKLTQYDLADRRDRIRMRNYETVAHEQWWTTKDVDGDGRAPYERYSFSIRHIVHQASQDSWLAAKGIPDA